MKEYPFNELDYLIRENGTGPLLAYIQEPNDHNLEVLRAGIPQRIQPDIDRHFWDVLSGITHSGGNPQDKIQHIFNYCFDLAYYRIKDIWYRPDIGDSYRRRLSKQYDKSVGVSTRSIQQKPEWEGYRQQYVAECDHFFNRLKDNLSDYGLVEEATQLDNPVPVAHEEPLPLRVEAKTFRNYGAVRDSVYNRAVDQLFDELTEQGLIGDTVKRDFRGLFLEDPFYQKISWVGTFLQLKYLINGLIDLRLISGKNKWLITVDCFTKDGDLIHIDQLKDTYIHRIKREHRATLDRILTVIRELIPTR